MHASANKNELEWWQIEKSIAEQIADKGAVAAFKANMQIKNPSITDLFARMNLAVRTGHNTEARNAIFALHAIPASADIPTNALKEACNFLIGKELWDLSKEFLEAFPQSYPGWGYEFIRHWAGPGEKSVDSKRIAEIDNWLIEREKASLHFEQQAMPNKNTRHSIYYSDDDYWPLLRIRLREFTRTMPVLVAELSQAIHNHPDNPNTVRLYLEAARRGRLTEAQVAWLPEVLKDVSAYELYKLGQIDSGYPALSLRLLQKSMNSMFSSKDKKSIENYFRYEMSAPTLQPPNYEQVLRTWTKQQMAQRYQTLGQSTMAQKLLVELSAEQKKSPLPSLALSQLAGQVQSQMPTKPLEKLIYKAEPDNKNNFNYWLGRAKYYTGRKDDGQVRDCYNKALTLVPLMPGADEAQCFNRSLVVSDLANYLRKYAQTTAEADHLLWREFEEHPMLAYRTRLINTTITSDGFRDRMVKATDERLWQHLMETKSWGYAEEHLLMYMFSSVPINERTPFWIKATKLAGRDGSREGTLGWVMTRYEASQRAVPILKLACASLSGEQKTRAQFTLFEAYLHLNDWRNAESIWPQARQQLTLHELAPFFSQVALAAARAGDKKEAMRLWQQKDSIDCTALMHLDEMAKAGMKSELLQYYATVERGNPHATYVSEARKILAESK